jgi:hypothetical protein
MRTKLRLETLIKYLHESDLKAGTYPESMLEGKSVGIDILDFALRDGAISEDEYEQASNYLKKLSDEID